MFTADGLAGVPEGPAAVEQATAAVAAQAVQRARLGAVLLDGFVAPTGERADRTDLFSGKHRLSGMNVQVIADLEGRVVDTGTPIGGARHDSVAFTASGLAERWAAHLADGGPGMLADKGYQGCGPSTPYRKPPGRPLTEVRKKAPRLGRPPITVRVKRLDAGGCQDWPSCCAVSSK